METLFANLEDRGEAVAIIDEHGRSVSYAAFTALADASVATLGSHRRLVLIEVSNRLAPLAAYVGALRAGHVVIPVAPGSGGDDSAIVEAFEPDAIFHGETWTVRAPSLPDGFLHPELAVLLSTSGSTGSPKLVRLSHANLRANARSIAQYLDIGPDERAITTLPMAYSYGLSVVHSHLLAGARLILWDGTVTDADFGRTLDRYGVTSFAGVPHSYDLLSSSGFRVSDHPSLRYLTQAGGRLAPDQVRAWAAQATQSGRRFFVMYGQTEAAPRIAYLPHEDAERHPDCIGRAIPGGELRLDPIDGGEDGELVYAGPNVMMGYADKPEDLRRGPELKELRTGDVARRTSDGYFRITGRLSRFAKVFGLRIGLDEVEARLAAAGVPAVVAADDEGLVVAAAPNQPEAAIAQVLTEDLHLPHAAFQVVQMAEIPRLSTGKVDYREILSRTRMSQSARDNDMRTALAGILGVERVGDDDSFVSLGGDSLNYVRAWLVMEEHLGRCPENWETMTIAELEGRAPDRRRMAIDSDVLARAVAIVMVVAHHVFDSSIGGGAASLLMVAGMSFSRFQAPKLLQGQLWTVLEPVLVKVLLPYMLIITAYFFVQHGVFLPQYLLVSNFTAPAGGDPLRMTIFWYIETYVWLILAASLAMTAEPVRRLQTRAPWTLALSLLVITFAVGAVARLNTHNPVFFDHTPFSMAYLFALGWAIPLAQTPGRKALLAILGAGALFAFERPGVEFAAPVTLAALALLLYVRKVPLGWKLTQVISMVAGASLYVYLSHGMVVHALRALMGGRIPLALTVPSMGLCLVVGVVLARLVDFGEGWFTRVLARVSIGPDGVAAKAG